MTIKLVAAHSRLAARRGSIPFTNQGYTGRHARPGATGYKGRGIGAERQQMVTTRRGLLNRFPQAVCRP